VGTESNYEPAPAVIIGLSPEVRGQLDRWFGPEAEKDDGILPEDVREAAKDPFREPENGPVKDSQHLSEEERQQVQELAARDAEVRAHENAHVAAAGGLSGAPSFTYEVGPDGKRYAIGGSVKIDLSRGSTPEETLNKAERVRAAAMAPAEPSSQDVSVASRASQLAAEARSEIAKEKQEQVQDTLGSNAEEEVGPWSKSAVSGGQAPQPGEQLDVLA